MGAVLHCLMTFFSFLFLALQMYFWNQDDPHMVTLMSGLCLMCCGILLGWGLAPKRKGGDKDAKNR